jgi:hypothetical protein
VKTCSFDGCSNPVFGGGFCKYHQYARKMQGGDQHKRKPIKRRTEKRAKDERYYKDQAKEFFDESDKRCVFCGKTVETFQGLHHWKGRTNDYLLDKRWWSVVHNDCHVYKWHRFTVAQLKEWLGGEYENFLRRLKLIDSSLWEKQTGKTGKLTPNLFDDEF